MVDARPDMFGAMRKETMSCCTIRSSRSSRSCSSSQQAAHDPDVVAIKQTVYRTGADSELMDILIDAARSGKEVTVVVELLARFDEEANINWAAAPGGSGRTRRVWRCRHKTHAKLLLVVRREDGGLRRYAHLSTGNYHARTAKLYTDFGLITCERGYLRRRERRLHPIDRSRQGDAAEASVGIAVHAASEDAARDTAARPRMRRPGRKGRIIAKMNALLEPSDRSAVRGFARRRGNRSHRAGRVRAAAGPTRTARTISACARSSAAFSSIHRVFYFDNDGAEDVYLASADWMARNFFRRVEVAFRYSMPKLKRRVINEGLTPYLQDNVQAWLMQLRRHVRPRDARQRIPPISAQNLLLERLAGNRAA